MKKEEKNTSKIKDNFTNKIEGKEALENLFETLDNEGILVEEREKPLLVRIKNLENEVSMLKDLFSRALQINKPNSILKD